MVVSEEEEGGGRASRLGEADLVGAGGRRVRGETVREQAQGEREAACGRAQLAGARAWLGLRGGSSLPDKQRETPSLSLSLEAVLPVQAAFQLLLLDHRATSVAKREGGDASCRRDGLIASESLVTTARLPPHTPHDTRSTMSDDASALPPAQKAGTSPLAVPSVHSPLPPPRKRQPLLRPTSARPSIPPTTRPVQLRDAASRLLEREQATCACPAAASRAGIRAATRTRRRSTAAQAEPPSILGHSRERGGACWWAAGEDTAGQTHGRRRTWR